MTKEELIGKASTGENRSSSMLTVKCGIILLKRGRVVAYSTVIREAMLILSLRLAQVKLQSEA